MLYGTQHTTDTQLMWINSALGIKGQGQVLVFTARTRAWAGGSPCLPDSPRPRPRATVVSFFIPQSQWLINSYQFHIPNPCQRQNLTVIFVKRPAKTFR